MKFHNLRPHLILFNLRYAKKNGFQITNFGVSKPPCCMCDTVLSGEGMMQVHPGWGHYTKEANGVTVQEGRQKAPLKLQVSPSETLAPQDHRKGGDEKAQKEDEHSNPTRTTGRGEGSQLRRTPGRPHDSDQRANQEKEGDSHHLHGRGEMFRQGVAG